MALLEQYEITPEHADLLWARLDEHARRSDGSCTAEGCTGTCWDRATARGQLMLAGLYAAGPGGSRALP